MVLFLDSVRMPAALGKHITYWRITQMTCLHYFFNYFLRRHIPKILGNIMIMSHYWYFWEPSTHFCKESGVPTMLVVLSFLLSIIPFIYPLLKMCHLYRKIATIDQLIKLTVPVSTTQGKMRLHFRIRAQLLALY